MNETPDEVKDIAVGLGLWLLMAYEAGDVDLVLNGDRLMVNGAHDLYDDKHAAKLRRWLDPGGAGD